MRAAISISIPSGDGTSTLMAWEVPPGVAQTAAQNMRAQHGSPVFEQIITLDEAHQVAEHYNSTVKAPPLTAHPGDDHRG